MQSATGSAGNGPDRSYRGGRPAITRRYGAYRRPCLTDLAARVGYYHRWRSGSLFVHTFSLHAVGWIALCTLQQFHAIATRRFCLVCRRVSAELHTVQIAVSATASHERVRRALLDNIPIFQKQYAINVSCGLEIVGDEQTGAPGH